MCGRLFSVVVGNVTARHQQELESTKVELSLTCARWMLTGETLSNFCVNEWPHQLTDDSPQQSSLLVSPCSSTDDTSSMAFWRTAALPVGARVSRQHALP